MSFDIDCITDNLMGNLQN